MTPTAQPFAAAEIAFRQERAAQQYSHHPRRHRVPRRFGLRLPHPHRRPVAVA